MSAAYLGSVKDGLLGTATVQPLAVWGVGGTIHDTIRATLGEVPRRLLALLPVP